MSDVWTRWEGHVINGTFPLLRCLGASDHSGVFLTEPKAGGLPKAAVKLVPAIPSLVEAQLSHWRAAAGLSHPRLTRLYDSGRCLLDERHFLFIVMEYAEQNLAEVLPHRALTAEEAREMLLPTLDALAFLHSRQRVQGQLKPSNILVVGDQIKLASDTIRPASESTANIGMPSIYDAPEGQREIFSTAGDIWALGVTLVEGLTQRPPSWADPRRETVMLAQDFPPPFADVVRRCLSADPKRRPDVAGLMSWVEGNAWAPGTQDIPRERPVTAERSGIPEVRDVLARGGATLALLEAAPERRSRTALIVGVVAVVVAGWAAMHLFSRHKAPELPPAPVAGASSETPPEGHASGAQPNAPAGKHASATQTQAAAASGVLHEEIPHVPRSALDTIHGHIKVAVRVTVDSTGSVVSENLEVPGPSRYFARLAMQAASQWRFAATEEGTPRVWLIRFEFSREGPTGHAVGPRHP